VPKLLNVYLTSQTSLQSWPAFWVIPLATAMVAYQTILIVSSLPPLSVTCTLSPATFQHSCFCPETDPIVISFPLFNFSVISSWNNF